MFKICGVPFRIPASTSSSRTGSRCQVAKSPTLAWWRITSPASTRFLRTCWSMWLTWLMPTWVIAIERRYSIHVLCVEKRVFDSVKLLESECMQFGELVSGRLLFNRIKAISCDCSRETLPCTTPSPTVTLRSWTCYWTLTPVTSTSRTELATRPSCWPRWLRYKRSARETSFTVFSRWAMSTPGLLRWARDAKFVGLNTYFAVIWNLQIFTVTGKYRFCGMKKVSPDLGEIAGN